MNKKSHTFRLFKKYPSFINGFSASLDFFGDEGLNYNTDNSEEEADLKSIYADWQAVGDDMRIAIKEHAAGLP